LKILIRIQEVWYFVYMI